MRAGHFSIFVIGGSVALHGCAGKAFEVGTAPDASDTHVSSGGASGAPSTAVGKGGAVPTSSAGSAATGGSGGSTSGGGAPVSHAGQANSGGSGGGGAPTSSGGTVSSSGGAPSTGSGGATSNTGGTTSSGGATSNTGGTTASGGTSNTGGVAQGSGGAATCKGSADCAYCCDQAFPSGASQKASALFSQYLYGCGCSVCYGQCDATLCNTSTPQPSLACIACLNDNLSNTECRSDWDKCQADPACAGFGACAVSCL